ncbi:MAG: SDR family NAD(P)-dependent oxidoreductase [Pirellulaceae bacterium]|nr:SDR family NAD(P)-dependent oxidoreductase [Pirellulaceae bacterium]
MGRLDGKVAVITGAGGGIGRQHALLFAAEGARVLVNDPGTNRDGSGQCDAADSVVQEIVAAGGEAVANKLAVGTAETAAEIMQATVDTFGKLDVLVNNAGILRDRTILKMTTDEWDDVIRVHLTGTFTCLQAAARIMKEQGTGGRIINTSSSSGLLGNFGQANYGAAKAGIYGLTRVAALEFSRYDITVNAIAPMAMTRMLESLPGIDAESASEALAPERISPMVAFLATAAAAKINGLPFGVEGHEIFAYRLLASHGVTRYETTCWTIEDIESSLQEIIHW